MGCVFSAENEEKIKREERGTAMKLLTLNTHSLREENQEQKLEWFLEAVMAEKPDIIALQEVNQTVSAMGADSM